LKDQQVANNEFVRLSKSIVQVKFGNNSDDNKPAGMLMLTMMRMRMRMLISLRVLGCVQMLGIALRMTVRTK
jgi:hypothetical protein